MSTRSTNRPIVLPNSDPLHSSQHQAVEFDSTTTWIVPPIPVNWPSGFDHKHSDQEHSFGQHRRSSVTIGNDKNYSYRRDLSTKSWSKWKHSVVVVSLLSMISHSPPNVTTPVLFFPTEQQRDQQEQQRNQHPARIHVSTVPAWAKRKYVIESASEFMRIFVFQRCNFVKECSQGEDERDCGECDFESSACGWEDDSSGYFAWLRRNASSIVLMPGDLTKSKLFLSRQISSPLLWLDV